MLYYYSWKLALGTTLILAFLFVVTLLLLAGLLRYERSIRSIDGVLSGLLLELLGGISTLRTAGAEAAPSRAGRGATPSGSHWGSARRRFGSGIHQWLAVYPILTAMIIYVGAIHMDPGLMDTGSFMAFSIAFAALMAAVLAVGYTSIGLLDLLPRYGRIRPILEEKPEFPAAVIEPVRLMGRSPSTAFRFDTQGRTKERRFSTTSAFRSVRANSWQSWARRARANRP